MKTADQPLDSPRVPLPECAAVGLLTSAFPPTLVDEAVRRTGRRELRRRMLPARTTVYFTLGLWLWPDMPYGEVLRRVVAGLVWSGLAGGRGPLPNSGSLTKARARLGPQPFRELFHLFTEGHPPSSVKHRTGLRVSRVEEYRLRAVGTPENLARQETPPDSVVDPPVAPLRLAVRFGDDKLLQDAAIAPEDRRRRSPAQELLLRSEPGALLVLGPGLVDREAVETVRLNGCHLIWALPPGAALPVFERLGDGTHVAVLSSSGRGARTGTLIRVLDPGPADASWLPPAPEEEPPRIATTLMDPCAWPGEEVLRLSPDRRSGRTVLDTVTPWSAGEPLLRSQKPDGVDQELWALLCVYQALSGLRPD